MTEERGESVYIPKQYGLGVTFASVLMGARTYGPVRRGGKTFWRNYRRAIPGGLSLFEMLWKRYDAALDAMLDGISQPLFHA